MDNNGAANNALRADQLDKLVLDSASRVSLAVGLEVAKVAYVAYLIGGSTVCLAMGVEVRSRGRAAVGVVTELVDMNTTLSIGIVAGDVPCNGGWGGLGGLLEGHRPGDFRITSDRCNCFDHVDGLNMFLRMVCECTSELE